MSDNYLILFPVDMEFMPNKENIQKAIKQLEQHNEDWDIGTEIYDEVTLVDIGENLETIICPECKFRNTFEIYNENDPVRLWWQSIEPAMEDVPASGVKVTMPCCNKIVAFTALKFDWPSGFAKFQIFWHDPEDIPTTTQLAELSKTLDCKLNKVFGWY